MTYESRHLCVNDMTYALVSDDIVYWYKLCNFIIDTCHFNIIMSYDGHLRIHKNEPGPKDTF